MTPTSFTRDVIYSRNVDSSRSDWGSLFRLVVSSFLVLACLSATGEASVELTIESPRRAYYRGEEILLAVQCVNTSETPIRNTAMEATLGGHVSASREIGELLPGARETAEVING